MRPSSVTPYQRKVAPVRRASSCHGIRLAWCSSSVVTMTSPGPTARSKPLVAQHIGHQVERLGGVLGEHQFVGIGPDERRDVGAALLVGVGGLFHQLMRAAVHPAIGGKQKLALGVQHLQRPLRRRTGIQVRQLISAAHDALEDGEIGADRREIQRRHGGSHGQVPAAPPA